MKSGGPIPGFHSVLFYTSSNKTPVPPPFCTGKKGLYYVTNLFLSTLLRVLGGHNTFHKTASSAKGSLQSILLILALFSQYILPVPKRLTYPMPGCLPVR